MLQMKNLRASLIVAAVSLEVDIEWSKRGPTVISESCNAVSVLPLEIDVIGRVVAFMISCTAASTSRMSLAL